MSPVCEIIRERPSACGAKMKAIFSKEVSALPENVKVVNEVDTMGATCMVEPCV